MINVAIDGPAGAGKSTLAKAVAKRLGYIYVDTGALYRAIALFVIQRGVDVYNASKVAAMLPMIDIELKYVGDEQRVYLCGENVTSVIRTQEVSAAASAVSAIAKVREFLFDLQLEMAQNNNVVMDGRDIGTVVLPNADVKIFLTASAEARARRRHKELVEKGHDVEFEAVLKSVNERDEQDMNRPIAPLKQAKDAILLDTTELSLEESEIALYNAIKDNLPRR
ncbi:MAG: (d)CMP kinase [Clostridia bacterium]|nr:(d)CMP kinase [Oscillospiraceae bacterium]MBQ6796920.1 (d)CMP kinase [Clostridia bacterium]